MSQLSTPANNGSSMSDGHYVLVLREVARFANIYNGSVTAPAAGGSTFRLTNLRGPSNGNTYREQFERTTGGPNSHWQSLTFSALHHAMTVDESLRNERGIVRIVNWPRCEWFRLRLRDEAFMWARRIRLQVVRERWLDRAKGELVLVQEPGRSFGSPLLIDEQAFAIQEFLRVFALLRAEVTVQNALDEPAREPRRLTGQDEWSRARSCEVSVKVLGDLPAPAGAAISPEEMPSEDN